MQAALEAAMSLDGDEHVRFEVVDVRAQVEDRVIRRYELARINALARELTPDQRLVLATQTALQMGCAEFCDRYGWSSEKYRKVAQRARARLRQLIALDERAVPPAAIVSEGHAGTHL
jgi:DNA-directed RNA polymerase specialized sigma24 family protein